MSVSVCADIPAVLSVDKAHFQECLLETLQEMFGPQCTDKLFQRDRLLVLIDDKQAIIKLENLVCGFLWRFWDIYLLLAGKWTEQSIPQWGKDVQCVPNTMQCLFLCFYRWNSARLLDTPVNQSISMMCNNILFQSSRLINNYVNIISALIMINSG